MTRSLKNLKEKKEKLKREKEELQREIEELAAQKSQLKGTQNVHISIWPGFPVEVYWISGNLSFAN